MFCSKCGAEMKPTDAFCTRCGTENRSAVPAEKKKKKALPIILSVVALTLILAAILIGRCFGPKALVRRAARAVSQEHVEKILRYIPKEIVNGEHIKRSDLEEAYDDFEEMYEEEYDLGQNIRVSSYKIVGTKTIKGKQLRYITETMEEYNMAADRISQVKEVSIKLKIKGSDKHTYEVMDVMTIKYKGKWYIIDMNGELF